MLPALRHEMTPLSQSDCFTLLTRVETDPDWPLHFHDGFELHFIINARGGTRVVGDHTAEVEDLELVLIGPNLQHAWFTNKAGGAEMREVMIQFHKDLFDEKQLHRQQFSFIRTMFDRAMRGILFSKAATAHIASRVLNLSQKRGFDSVLELMSILHHLSMTPDFRLLSSCSQSELVSHWRRVDRSFEYMNRNFDKPITLAEMAQLTAMSELAFSRFFKARTGNTFIDTLNEIRLGNASRMLIDTTHSIAEIAYHCGFNNISSFNRIFKKKKSCTPKEFREGYTVGTRIFV
jgi:AraC-like DNA-binding protein